MLPQLVILGVPRILRQFRSSTAPDTAMAVKQTGDIFIFDHRNHFVNGAAGFFAAGNMPFRVLLPGVYSRKKGAENRQILRSAPLRSAGPENEKIRTRGLVLLYGTGLPRLEDVLSNRIMIRRKQRDCCFFNNKAAFYTQNPPIFQKFLTEMLFTYLGFACIMFY